MPGIEAGDDHWLETMRAKSSSIPWAKGVVGGQPIVNVRGELSCFFWGSALPPLTRLLVLASTQSAVGNIEERIEKMSAEQSLSTSLLRDALARLGQLSRTGLAAGVVGFAAALFLADTLRSWYRLSHVPGPFWAAFSKYWLVRQSLKGQQPYAFQEANEKYGQSYPLRCNLP